MIKVNSNPISFQIDDLLYGNGLHCYLNELSKCNEQCRYTSLPQPVNLSEDKVPRSWQRVLNLIKPPTIRAVIQQQCCLLSFDLNSGIACVGVSSEKLYQLQKDKIPNIEAAFEKVWHQKVKVKMKVTQVKNPETIS